MKKVNVVGAGILGAATAYELVQRGIEVTIVDHQAIGQATAAAAGIICPWISKRRNKAWYELAKYGAANYEQLISNLELDGETDTGYKKVGAIRLHTEQEQLEKLAEIALERRRSAPQIGKVETLSIEETSSLYPYLQPIYHSLYIEGAARVDGAALRDALIRASVKRGAIYIEGNAQLIHDKGDIVGIQVSDKQILADVTIATNGVWMPELFSPLGIHLNILSQKGEIVHLQKTDERTSDLPVVMPPNNQYMLSFDDNRIVIGATQKKSNAYESRNSAGGIHYMLTQALEVAPKLSDWEIADMRVGFRPVTFHHLPVFGSVSNLDGMLIANGLGASGLTTGPFIGKQLAKMVAGEPTDVPVENYSVDQIIANK